MLTLIVSEQIIRRSQRKLVDTQINCVIGKSLMPAISTFICNDVQNKEEKKAMYANQINHISIFQNS